jgi:glycosyltransferase involved in cell wall biosynthesis
MQILFLAGRELTYQRNDVLLRAFRRIGQVDVIENDRPSQSLVWNSLWVGLRALTKLISGKYDLIVVGFYGHLLMLVVGILARLRQIPVLFDVFVSNYDTLVHDRQTVSSSSMAARLAAWLDKTSCRLADHLLLDTQLHVNYFVQTFQLPSEKFSVVPVGCNEEIFSPKGGEKYSPNNEVSKVLYYCTYLPLHGADVVVRAAEMLKKEPVHFHLIGTGQEYERVRQSATGLHNIQFSPSVPLETLRGEIARANICLGGHFGASDKAGRVIPGKVYQILAMARPLIASNSPANRILLVDRSSALLVPPGNSHALVEAILTLHGDASLRETIRQNGRKVYESVCSEAAITNKLTNIIRSILKGGL